MCSGQIKRSLTVVKIRRLPRSRRVTSCAIVVEIVLRMIWISRAGKITAVTIEAQCRRVGVTRRVTRYAICRSMCPGQDKSGR